jgi:hypothetical protein
MAAVVEKLADLAMIPTAAPLQTGQAAQLHKELVVVDTGLVEKVDNKILTQVLVVVAAASMVVVVALVLTPQAQAVAVVVDIFIQVLPLTLDMLRLDTELILKEELPAIPVHLEE